MNIYLKGLNKIKSIVREIIFVKRSKKITNNSFSLFSSNCIGAFILHDLGIKFQSPTVNLFMYPKDFIRFVSNLEYYLGCELILKKEENTLYPIGYLDDVEIHFMHYKSESDAKQKWEERANRINHNNIFIMMTDRDGCTFEDLLSFDRLPYKNKVVFTHRKYPEIKSAYYIKGFENQKNVGDLYKYKSLLTLKKYYDDFSYIEWFNNELN